MTAMINTTCQELSGTTARAEYRLFQHEMPERLVHRTHQKDVFVDSLRVTGPSHFQVSARWPATHDFYGPVRGLHDPLLLLETVREALFVVCHTAYDIPRDTSYITHEKQFDVNLAGLGTAVDGDVELMVDVTAHDIKRRGRAIAGMRLECVCYRDGMPIGNVTYRISMASSAVYNRLRGDHRAAKPALACDTPPVAPRTVGRTQDIDVLLTDAPDGRSWHLRIDPTHPVIFDHVIDHVPGNAAVEAARQAAYLTLGRPDAVLLSGAMTFDRYIEFDTPCLVVGEQIAEAADGVRTVKVGFVQDDKVMAEGTFQLYVRR
jgi:hypothetical protein